MAAGKGDVMSNITTAVHVVKIKTQNGTCTPVPKQLQARAGDSIVFTNDTEKKISITLSNSDILDTVNPFYISGSGGEHSAEVKSGTGGDVRCMIDCDAEAKIQAMTTKPEIIVNRE